MTSIAAFVAKHKKQVTELSIDDKIRKLPWYKRPIERSAFLSRKAKNGEYYIKHNEWSQHIWIGPYNTMKEVNDIIDSYIETSSVKPLDKVTSKENKIHSVCIENLDEFFE